MKPRKNECVLNYFGGKTTSAHKYPAPHYPLIIEPFAGGAGYSLLYREHDVVLADLDEHITLAWDYLVHATPAEVEALPLLGAGQHVDTLGLEPGPRALVRFCLQFAPGPRNTITGFGRDDLARGRASVWGAKRRARLARICAEIQHWIVCQCSYERLPDCEATWFIDPPYQGPAGDNYNHGSIDIDYAALAAWVLSRKGQVIVCENEGANWLPFDTIIENRSGITYDSGVRRRKNEVVYHRSERA